MRDIDDNMRMEMRSKRIGTGLSLSEAASLLSVTPTSYKVWEDGSTTRCTDKNHRNIRFFLEGLLDSFIKRATFPLSKDDRTLLRKLFTHRTLLEMASPEELAAYKAELAAIAIKSI